MNLNRTIQRGFTLVEILIVVIILGILAAIVIPQFTNATEDARRSSLAAAVQSMREQVGQYKLTHGDELPDLTADWTPFTATSTYGTPPKVFGPYMRAEPANLLTGSNAVIDGDATYIPTDDTAGFVYDFKGGEGSGKLFGIDKYIDDKGSPAYRLIGD